MTILLLQNIYFLLYDIRKDINETTFGRMCFLLKALDCDEMTGL
jgi:hypothetical protein